MQKNFLENLVQVVISLKFKSSIWRKKQFAFLTLDFLSFHCIISYASIKLSLVKWTFLHKRCHLWYFLIFYCCSRTAVSIFTPPCLLAPPTSTSWGCSWVLGISVLWDSEGTEFIFKCFTLGKLYFLNCSELVNKYNYSCCK